MERETEDKKVKGNKQTARMKREIENKNGKKNRKQEQKEKQKARMEKETINKNRKRT